MAAAILPYIKTDTSCSRVFLKYNCHNARDRNRTGTVLLQQDFKSCASASSATRALYNSSLDEIKWAEVDSNHRSNLQQIYSLSPLATRESAHFTGKSFHTLTENYFNTSIYFFQELFVKKEKNR